MMIAKRMVVREKFTDKQDKPVFFKIKHSLRGFKLKDRLLLKSWNRIHALKETAKRVRAKVLGKERSRDRPNFNRFLWDKEYLLVGEAIKTVNGEGAKIVNELKLKRAAALSELGANHLMGLHEEIKKGDYAVGTSCIIPAIALNNYMQEGQRIPLTEERAKQAAEMAAEVAQTCDKYDSRWAREQLPATLVALGRFLELTAGVKGIEKEREIVRAKLEKGSFGLDAMNAEGAYHVLLTSGGDEAVAECRRCILEIRDAGVRKSAMERCQEYWSMYWFGQMQPCALFPKEFTTALERMDILKN